MRSATISARQMGDKNLEMDAQLNSPQFSQLELAVLKTHTTQNTAFANPFKITGRFVENRTNTIRFLVIIGGGPE